MLRKLGPDDSQTMLQQSVAAACRPSAGETAGQFSPSMWKRIAATGVLALGTDEGGGGPQDIAAAHEAMGAEAVSGPLAATVVAMHTLDGTRLAAIATGDTLVGMQVGDQVSWSPPAQQCIELTGHRGWLCTVPDGGTTLDTLAGEPWTEVRGVHLEELEDVEVAVARADLASAAYLVGAGLHLLELSVAHALGRRQFGKDLGSFQAIAHPLARCEAELMTARQLVRLTALEQLRPGALAGNGAATAAHIAERAALSMAYTAHQTHGALGFTTEATVARYSTRIRQASLTRPGRLRAAHGSPAGLRG
jgi:alkylation response protein AidB-like acyl-CoA dehydrogenase